MQIYGIFFFTSITSYNILRQLPIKPPFYGCKGTTFMLQRSKKQMKKGRKQENHYCVIVVRIYQSIQNTTQI